MQDAGIKELVSDRKCNALIVFNNMIIWLVTKNLIVNKLFIRARKLNVSTVFITHVNETSKNHV